MLFRSSCGLNGAERWGGAGNCAGEGIWRESGRREGLGVVGGAASWSSLLVSRTIFSRKAGEGARMLAVGVLFGGSEKERDLEGVFIASEEDGGGGGAIALVGFIVFCLVIVCSGQFSYA